MILEFCDLCHRHHGPLGCFDSKFANEMQMLSLRCSANSQPKPITEDTVIDLTDMPEGIKVTLTADRYLPPEAVKALADMIQIVAKEFKPKGIQ